MKKTRFLWVDDEIELLHPYVLFLEEKGYEVVTVNSGLDALDKCKEETFDLIFLDENMPGLSGLDTLAEIKMISPSIPVVMITKSEDEGIMNKAIGNKIADYLIKPVNPNQILLTIKKNLDKTEMVSEATTVNYREKFNKLSQEINSCSTYTQWIEVYKQLLFWELELEESNNPMSELLQMQKSEANGEFAKFIKKNYTSWIKHPEDAPLMSPALFKKKVFPLLDNGEKVFFILLDNFRLDQWLIIKDLISEYYTCKEDTYYSILPSTTQYARNSLFAGLMPLQISEMFPQYWVDENEEEGYNLHEEELIQSQLDRYRKKYSFSYNKIFKNSEGDKLVNQFNKLETKDLNVVVFNFIDMLSHSRTESKMMRELIPNESAYRAMTRSWFMHSSIMDFIKKIAEKGYKVILTTDHGTVRVKEPEKVVGLRETSTNLRYKQGKNLGYNAKKVLEATNPREIGLPSINVSSKYIFALYDSFFAYPNNYNYYVSYYMNTFQHGGISLEELIIPCIELDPK